MVQKILVVEDEPAIAETLIYALKTEGFSVEWRTTGADAFATLERGGVDLLLLDVGLPDQSGFELCKRIRKQSQVPIIFLTARTDEVDRVVGLEIGGDDYVAKPFSPREVSARVKAVLRRISPAPTAPTPPSAPPQAGSPFALDMQRQCITYFGTLLDLSRYEFRILEVFLRHPGWVYSREKLMDMAWEAPDASMDRTVDTHIKTIRAKLREINPDIDPIRTHRGLGYSLRDSW